MRWLGSCRTPTNAAQCRSPSLRYASCYSSFGRDRPCNRADLGPRCDCPDKSALTIASELWRRGGRGERFQCPTRHPGRANLTLSSPAELREGKGTQRAARATSGSPSLGPSVLAGDDRVSLEQKHGRLNPTRHPGRHPGRANLTLSSRPCLRGEGDQEGSARDLW